MSKPTQTGQCLCGGVRYEVRGAMRQVIGCHCSQCRQTSGNFVAATACARTDLHFVSDATLAWYRSSELAERGFCRRCGGNLFWRSLAPDSTTISLMAGTLDPPTGLRTTEHIFVAGKSDFYDLTDDAPRHAEWG